MLVTTADTVPPSNPGNLTGNAAGTTVSLSWTASTDDIGVAGYNVIRDGVWIANTSQTSYNDLGLSTSTTYGYQIQAFDLAGNTSVMTPTLSLSTVYTLPPSAPTNVTAGPYSTQGMTITWTASQDPMGISSYQIYRGTSPTGLAQVMTVKGTMTSYKDNTLAAGTTYYYGVTATQAQYVSDHVRHRFRHHAGGALGSYQLAGNGQLDQTNYGDLDSGAQRVADLILPDLSRQHAFQSRTNRDPDDTYLYGYCADAGHDVLLRGARD